MSRPATTNDTKRALRRGVLAATLAALIGIFSAGISAAGPEQTFSVFVHIDYPDGFVYEHAFAAAQRGWIEFRRAGEVIDVGFGWLLRPVKE